MATKFPPKHLMIAMDAISHGQGDDIGFVLGYLSSSVASSYVSRLKKLGLAYTHRSNGTNEVWLHPKGMEVLKVYRAAHPDFEKDMEKLAES